MTHLTIELSDQDGITIMKPHGRIEVQQMLQLRNFIKRLESLEVTRVAVDMESVTFVDSYGVSALANFSNQLRLREGWVVFFRCTKEVTDFLKIAGVDQIIPMFDTFEQVKEKLVF
jgi:anti-anti-sigma factor